jgi:hypothetical protein
VAAFAPSFRAQREISSSSAPKCGGRICAVISSAARNPPLPQRPSAMAAFAPSFRAQREISSSSAPKCGGRICVVISSAARNPLFLSAPSAVAALVEIPLCVRNDGAGGGDPNAGGVPRE